MMAAPVALSHGRRRSVGSPTAAAGLAVTLRDGELGRPSCGHRRFGRHPPRRRARPALLRPQQEAWPSLSAAASAVSSSASGALSSSDGATFVGSADGVRPTSPRPPREVSYFFCLWFLYFFFSSINYFYPDPPLLALPVDEQAGRDGRGKDGRANVAGMAGDRGGGGGAASEQGEIFVLPPLRLRLLSQSPPPNSKKGKCQPAGSQGRGGGVQRAAAAGRG